MKKTDKIFNRALVNQIKKAERQIQNLESEFVGFMPEWSDPVSLGYDGRTQEKGGLSVTKKIGVYGLIYEPTEEIMYIGQGIINDRKSTHKLIFKNKGKVIEHPGGTRTDSPAGRKLFDYDPDIDNWLFQYCLIPNKQLCAEYKTWKQTLNNDVKQLREHENIPKS